MTALEAIRIFGPCDYIDVAMKTGRCIEDVGEDIEHLDDQGLIRFVGPNGPFESQGLWDVTEAGRELFTRRIERKGVAA